MILNTKSACELTLILLMYFHQIDYFLFRHYLLYKEKALPFTWYRNLIGSMLIKWFNKGHLIKPLVLDTAKYFAEKSSTVLTNILPNWYLTDVIH